MISDDIDNIYRVMQHKIKTRTNTYIDTLLA